MVEPNASHQEWLDSVLARVDAFAGTVHVQRGEDLYLPAARNIPPRVAEIVAHVPHGKGMAGAAQVKKTPVQTCNLQADDNAEIKPGAKAVDAQAAIALPVFDAGGGVRAVVGLAWQRPGEIDADTQESLMAMAAGLPTGKEPAK